MMNNYKLSYNGGRHYSYNDELINLIRIQLLKRKNRAVLSEIKLIYPHLYYYILREKKEVEGYIGAIFGNKYSIVIDTVTSNGTVIINMRDRKNIFFYLKKIIRVLYKNKRL